MSDYKELVEALNAATKEERLAALRAIKAQIDAGTVELPPCGGDVNNHIHTSYSFSPYSPTKAVYMAKMAGLETAGIMDHDSIAGAREFIEAGRIFDMPTTVGIECRVSFRNTPLNGKLTNNPDQHTVTYMALHGVPHTQIEKVQAFFAEPRRLRNVRNRREVEKINALLAPAGIALDFDADIVPISMAADGGTITERHILYALANKMIERCGKGPAVTRLLKSLNIGVGAKAAEQLSDPGNPHYAYDLVGVMKSDFVPLIFVEATEECYDVEQVIAFSEEVGAISAYAYLGDVGDSVTGDKKTQKFEDDYIDALFDTLDAFGFRAVTYMPSRNTRAQLDRVRALCDAHGLFQISGEDINQPRQSFVCMAMRDPDFLNLYDAAWALIGHELSATESLSNSMFADASQPLAQRILRYRDFALQTYGKRA